MGECWDGDELISATGTDRLRHVPDFLPALDAAALPPGKGETVLLNGCKRRLKSETGSRV